MFDDIAELLAANAVVIGYAALAVVSATLIATGIMGCPRRQAPQPDLQASLRVLRFRTTTRVSQDDRPIPLAGPHWLPGANAAVPAVFLLAEIAGAELQARVRIDSSVGQPATGTLTANFAGLRLECNNCPLDVGVHDVVVRVRDLPQTIAHFNASPAWTLTSNVTVRPLGPTPLELFVILAAPGPAFAQGVVWAEALRFLCGPVGLIGSANAATATSRITTYCHQGHNLTYESANHYTYALLGVRFCLDAFIARSDANANCYDLAGAVQVLSHAVGSPVDYKYASAYGYINTTSLVGVANCNNPGYGALAAAPLVLADSVQRTGFCDHAFCVLNARVYDACMGPHLGTQSVAQYLQSAIDRTDAADGLRALGRDNHPTENAGLADIAPGAITVLDRGRAGQLVRRAIKTELERQGVEARLSDIVGAFKGLTGANASTGKDVPIIEQRLEEELTGRMDRANDYDARAAVEALGAEADMHALVHLNRAYATNVPPDDLHRALQRREEDDKKQASASDEKAWNTQIEARQTVVEMAMMTASEFDDNETKQGRKVYPYDAKTLKRI